MGAEDLILAQIGGHQAQVQARRFDRIGDLRRQAATEVRSGQSPLGDHAGRQDALQQRDEAGRVIAIASPHHLWRKRQTLGVVRQTPGLLGHPAQFRGQITIPSSQLLLGGDREEMIADLRLAPEDTQTFVGIVEADLRFLRACPQVTDQGLILHQGHQQAGIRRTTVIRIREQTHACTGRFLESPVSLYRGRRRHLADAAVTLQGQFGLSG